MDKKIQKTQPGGPDGPGSIKEPFSATKHWTGLVAVFRTEIPLTTNTFRSQSYARSFVGTAAISWFRAHLENNYKIKMSRVETLALLQGFFRAGIFDPVYIPTEPIPSPGVNFQDNGSLYKLASDWNVFEAQEEAAKLLPENRGTGGTSAPAPTPTPAPPAPAPTPSPTPAPVPLGLTNYTVVVKPLKREEMWAIWKDVFTERLVQVFGKDILNLFPPSNPIHGDKISYNMSQISQFGIVMNSSGPDEDEGLPSWVKDAMKCLASWPGDDDLDKSAPGFEKDVFSSIVEYFEVQKTQGNPLMTSELYDAIMAAFVRADLFDKECRIYNPCPKDPEPEKTEDETSALNISASLEDLLMEPKSDHEQKKSKSGTPMMAMAMGSKSKRFFGNEAPAHAQENCFSSPEAPFVNFLVPSSLPKKSENPGTGTKTSTSKPAPVGRLRILDDSYYTTESTAQIPRYTCLASETEVEQSTSSSGFPASTFPSTPERPSSSSASGSGSNLSTSAYETPGFATARSLDYGIITPTNSPSLSVRKTLDFYYGADDCDSGLITPKGKNLGIVSFRLLTLLLPPQNRRHLQLLLRCMSKMVRNEKLMLGDGDGMTNRAIVINSFFRAIVFPTNPMEFDELIALRLVTFLVDNDKEIFSLGDEKEFISGKVEKILNERQIKKIPDPDPTVETGEGKENQYCKRITLEEYEKQKFDGTAQALRQLLDSIDSMKDEKLKKQQLKHFSKQHPDIYATKYGPETPARDEALRELFDSLDSCKSEKSKKKRLKKFRKQFNF